MGPVSVVMGGVQLAQDALSKIASNLPRYMMGCHVIVHGNRQASQAALMDLAIAIAFNRVGGISFWATTMSECSISYSLSENMVEVDVKHSWGEDTAIAAAGAGGLALGLGNSVIPPPASNGFNGFVAAMKKPYPVSIDSPAGPQTLLTQADSDNPRMNDSGTRGTWLENLVIQALYGPTSPPPAPP